MNKNGTVELSNHVKEAEWKSAKSKIGGSIYNGYNFSYSLKNEGINPLYFTLRNTSGEIVGLSIGFIVNQWRRWPLNKIYREIHFNTHPSIDNNSKSLTDYFLSEIIIKSKDIGISAIKMKSEDSRTSSIEEKFYNKKRIEFHVDLTESSEYLFKKISSMRRRHINKTLKDKSIKTIEENNITGVLRLLSFQESSRERRRARGEDYAITPQSEANNLFDKYVERGIGRVFISYKNDSPLCGVMVHSDGVRAYYTIAGCSPEGFQCNAPGYLIWKMMLALKNDGVLSLNLGGVKEEASSDGNIAHGLYSFKKSFGSEEVSCIDWHCDDLGVRSKLAKILKVAL